MQPRPLRLIRIFRTVRAAMEETAQQAVAALTDIADAPQHALERNAHQYQRMRSQHQTRLESLRHHLRGPCRNQALQIAVIQRAHNDREAGIEFMHMMQNAQRSVRIGKGNHHCAGARDAGGNQGFPAGRITEYHLFASRRRFTHPFRIRVKRDIADLFLLEQMGQPLSRPAIAADHDMALGGNAFSGNAVQFKRAQHPLRTGQPHHQAIAVVDQKGGRQHRQQHGRHHHLRKLGINHRGLHRQRHDHQPELSGLCERKRTAQSRARGTAEHSRQGGHQSELEQHRRKEQQQHQRQVVCHDVHVKLHAHRDKEQPEENIAERFDVLLNLMTVFGFGDQHAGKEGTQRHRQAGKARKPGQAQRYQQHVEDKEFMGAALRNHAEPDAHHTLPEEQQHYEHHHRLEQGNAQGRRQCLATIAHGRHHDQQRNDGQVLEQQHAEYFPPVRRFQLAPFSDHAYDNRSR